MPKIPRHHLLLLPTILTIALLLLALLAGCDDTDKRLTELGQQSCQRQAEQNETIAKQNEKVTDLSKDFLESENQARRDLIKVQQELAKADAESRDNLVQVQQDLVERDAEGRQQLNSLQKETQSAAHVERQEVSRQRDGLEAERQKLAQERQTAPVVAAAVMQIGLILACLLPLALAGYLIYMLRQPGDADEAVTELLLSQMVAEQSPLMLSNLPSAALPALTSENTSNSQGDEPCHIS